MGKKEEDFIDPPQVLSPKFEDTWNGNKNSVKLAITSFRYRFILPCVHTIREESEESLVICLFDGFDVTLCRSVIRAGSSSDGFQDISKNNGI